MTTLLLITAAAVILAAAALWSLRRSRLDHSDLERAQWEQAMRAPLAYLDRRAEIALRVRDRLGPAGDDEHEFAAVLAEVERLVVA